MRITLYCACKYKKTIRALIQTYDLWLGRPAVISQVITTYVILYITQLLPVQSACPNQLVCAGLSVREHQVTAPGGSIKMQITVDRVNDSLRDRDHFATIHISPKWPPTRARREFLCCLELCSFLKLYLILMGLLLIFCVMLISTNVLNESCLWYIMHRNTRVKLK